MELKHERTAKLTKDQVLGLDIATHTGYHSVHGSGTWDFTESMRRNGNKQHKAFRDMKNTASSVVYTGSYWMSAEPFAACLACIPKMKRLNIPEMFREKGIKLTDGFKAAAKEHGFKLVVSGEPALFYLRIANDDTLMLHQEWIAECVSRGLFLASHHNHFINASLTDEDIALAVDIAEDAFSVVAARHPEIGLK